MAVIQGKILEIMGPLGAAWASLEVNKIGDTESFDPENVAEQVKKACILVGHAMNKVSWFRRLHILGSIGKTQDARRLLLEEKNQKIFAECATNDLFSTKFDDGLKEELVSRKTL